MKALITGVNGFVGEYLSIYLKDKGIEIYGTDIIDKGNSEHAHFIKTDLLDEKSTSNMLLDVNPDYIFHLAGQSNVGLSWKDPALTMRVNIMGTVNLMDAVRKAVPKAKMLIIGSADQYGTVLPEMCPLKEDMPINPESPYALSKTLQEQAAQFYIKHFGLNIVLVRAFNHIGPGQRLGFVIPDFACRIAQIEHGLLDRLDVGNLSAARDFSDVRDIVRGYYLLMEKGQCGHIYNIGSGRPRKISDILTLMLSFSKIDIKVYEDPSKMRPSDAPLIYGDCTKIRNDVGYVSEFCLEDTLREVLDYWRERVVNERKKEGI
jgi:GDP-4-dehydro-6-deoxy-D-mannose reductase